LQGRKRQAAKHTTRCPRSAKPMMRDG
jgi:hypothetical protein